MVKLSHSKLFETFFSKTKNSNKVVHIAGYLSLNLLDQDTCKRV